MKPRTPEPNTELDPTDRFSDRVDFYVRYRPGYPERIMALLRQDCALKPESVIADLGSGTGLLSRLFLENDNTVFGVEPNPNMRQAGEHHLRDFPAFHSVAGTAEDTGLSADSVDFVTAGQAFHWFDGRRCRREFRRILKDAGWLVLIWNERLTKASPFLRAYEQLLRTHGTDYDEVQHRAINDDLVRPVFGDAAFTLRVLDNSQAFDYPGLEGRLLSSSYVPNEGQPGYDAMIDALKRIFDEHECNGEVSFKYATKVFYGRLKC